MTRQDGNLADCNNPTNLSRQVWQQQLISLVYILTDKYMGNGQHSTHKLFTSYLHTNNNLDNSQHPFLVKQLLAQTPHHHRQLLSKITKLKQAHCDHFLRIIDSHTVETHHLCSTISHIYVLMEKPTYTLQKYSEKLRNEGVSFNNEAVWAILVSLVKSMEYLSKQGQQYRSIDESMIFITELGNRQISVKLMYPFFAELDLEKQQQSTIEQQIAAVLLALKTQLTQDLANLIVSMREGRASLKEVAEKLPVYSVKQKIGLKLAKNIADRPKITRESINSLASNGESLMINGGDVSEQMFKDFYQHFDDSLSDIQMRSVGGCTFSETVVDQEMSHQFPKRYLKNKAFKKNSHRETGSELWSDRGSEKNNITRDQSLKDNFRIESKTFLLSSAKLVESFVSELHQQ